MAAGVGDGGIGVPNAGLRLRELGLEASATASPMTSATTGIATTLIQRIAVSDTRGVMAGEF
jgi:hypothetical protein